MNRVGWALAAVLAAVGFAGGVIFERTTHETVATKVTVSFMPEGALMLDVRRLRTSFGPEQLAVAWARTPPGSVWAVFGLSIRQRDQPGASWRQVYSRRIPTSKERGMHDIRLRTADVTGEGREDLLVVEDHGGSAGAFVYRLLTTTDNGEVRQIEARRTSEDETTVLARYGELVSFDAVGKDPKTIPGIHCCPLYWQRTVKRWNGQRLVTFRVSRVQQRPIVPR
jgi:hypothetical protein